MYSVREATFTQFYTAFNGYCSTWSLAKKASAFENKLQEYFCSQQLILSSAITTVEATYKGRLYKGTAAYKGTVWKVRIFSYLLCTNFCPL